jgi:N-methylhydantoinase A
VDPGLVNGIYEDLERQARDDLRAWRREGNEPQIQRQISLRFRRQTHELRLPLGGGVLRASDLDAVVDAFEEEFERIFGRGTSYRRAGIEISTFRLRCTLPLHKPVFRPLQRGDKDAREAIKDRRDVFFAGRFVESPIYTAEDLRSGHVIEGPAVIEGAALTVPVHPGQSVYIDEHLNLVLTPAPTSTGDKGSRDGRGRVEAVVGAARAGGRP